MLRLSALLVLLAAPSFAQSTDAGVRPRVAVLYFVPNTNDPDLQAFGKGLASLMITDLVNYPSLQVLERERLEDAMAELKLGETKFADKATFAKIGKMLGVQYMVVGGLMGIKGHYVIAARAIKYPLFDDVVSARAEFSGDDVFAAETQIVRDLAAKLVADGSELTVADPVPPKTFKLPLKTASTYSRALSAKDKKDTATATKLLGEVVKEQPDFKLAQLDLLSLTK
jgi:TolB-like protein